jgi:hypothetical protein
MERRNRTATSGEVEWPLSDLWQHTGEGGMWVSAFWRVPEGEAWQKCIGPGRTYSFEEHAVGVDTGESYASWFPSDDEREQSEKEWTEKHPDVHYFDTRDHFYDYLSGPFYGAIDLGTTGGSWIHPESGEYFVCTRANLTRRGKMIVTMLDNLYGVTGKLVTFLDT